MLVLGDSIKGRLSELSKEESGEGIAVVVRTAFQSGSNCNIAFASLSRLS